MRCQVENCERHAVRRGYCGPHYKKVWRYGCVPTCKRDGCDREANGRYKGWCEGCSRPSCSVIGLCSMHSRRLQRNGDPLVTRCAANGTWTEATCCIGGCEADACCRGMCREHYGFWKHSDGTRVIRKQRKRGTLKDVPSDVLAEEQKIRHKRYCKSEYGRAMQKERKHRRIERIREVNDLRYGDYVLKNKHYVSFRFDNQTGALIA